MECESQHDVMISIYSVDLCNVRIPPPQDRWMSQQLRVSIGDNEVMFQCHFEGGLS